MLHVSAVYSAIFRPIQNIMYTEVYSMGSHFVLHYMVKVPEMFCVDTANEYKDQ
jgi:hypothetical protein